MGKYGLLTNEEHEIFNTPNKVNLEWQDVKTPKYFQLFGGYGKTIKMWKVQTMGYEKGSLLEPGLVSRGQGFTDSPDAEFISEGNHTKMPGQVAIGRHGNFFHWGYSAPPKYMTEQGKLVFLNAIHYIAKFKGQRILSPKLDDGMWLQESIKDNGSKDYQEYYESYVSSVKETNIQMENMLKELLERKENGEKLTDQETASMQYMKPQPIPSIEEFMAMIERSLYQKFGTDFRKYNEYYTKYAPYMRANPKNLRSSMIDEDAMDFGMSFSDPKFLESCIKSLNEPNKKELALKLLKRYTLESFENQKDWKKWHKKHKKALFFTETGGCKYMVNPY